jgi:hypothetical protein
MGQRIKLRTDTFAGWNTSNPILADGELGFDKTQMRFRFGDGVTAFKSLQYFQQAPLVFFSSQITTVINTANIQAHLLGAAPYFVQTTLVCLVAANGYSVGEFVDAFATRNFAISWDTINVSVRFGTALPSIIPKGGGAAVAIVAASWALQWRASK